MKKLITILTIMIVLVGAVFASDPINGDTSNGTADIKITAVVSEQHPLFQLKTTSTATGAISAITKASQSIATDPEDAAGSITLVKDYLLNNASATINFSIGQINRSSSKAHYDLTVTATPLKRIADSAGTEVSTYDPGTEVFALADGNATPAISRSTNAGITSTQGATANVMHLVYSGATVSPAGDPAYLELGTFSVTWTQNANALAGTYSADVYLAVTATT